MDARAFHEDCIVIDAHADPLLYVPLHMRRLTERSDKGHVDLPRLREGGVTAQVFAIPGLGPTPTLDALCMLDTFYSSVDESPDLILATRAADVRRAKAEGHIAGVLSLEGVEPLAGDLRALRTMYRNGVRMVGLTHNKRNEAGDGVGEAGTGGGLTAFGRQLVKEANRLGMIIDIAHLAPAGVRDVLELCDAPPVVSHGNARAVRDHPRNLTDEQLQSLASKGGVCCVMFWPCAVGSTRDRQTLEGVLDHIDHIVRVAGPDHVGLGSDFDGFGARPDGYWDPRGEVARLGPEFFCIPFARSECVGLESPTCYPAITSGLVARGHTEETVRKIMGGNLLRVFEQVLS